jgi:hypothetical protein
MSRRRLRPFLAGLGLRLTRVGLEAGPLSQWLHAGLRKAGVDVVLLETRHVKAALSAMIVKSDRRDARGIAQLLPLGERADELGWSASDVAARCGTISPEGNMVRGKIRVTDPSRCQP